MAAGESMEPVTSERVGGKRAWLRPVALIAVLAGLVAAAFVLPVSDTVRAVLDWTGRLGVWGPLVVAAFYVVACVLMLPGSALTLGAGFLFDVFVGTVTVSISGNRWNAPTT